MTRTSRCRIYGRDSQASNRSRASPLLYANRLRAEGKELTEAVRIASETRFTPIVVTTLTTIAGLLPLTLTGSSLWSPLGTVIISGLVVSTLLTLIVVPVLYKTFTPESPVTAVA